MRAHSWKIGGSVEKPWRRGRRMMMTMMTMRMMMKMRVRVRVSSRLIAVVVQLVNLILMLGVPVMFSVVLWGGVMELVTEETVMQRLAASGI